MNYGSSYWRSLSYSEIEYILLKQLLPTYLKFYPTRFRSDICNFAFCFDTFDFINIKYCCLIVILEGEDN